MSVPAAAMVWANGSGGVKPPPRLKVMMETVTPSPLAGKTAETGGSTELADRNRPASRISVANAVRVRNKSRPSASGSAAINR